MANRRRGEIEAILDGKPHTLVLTLGALAELEHAFGASDLVALAERFESGRLAAGDILAVIAAGLRGGGHSYTRDEVAALVIDGGAAGYVRLAADLLAATFMTDTDAPEAVAPARPRPAREMSSPSPAPPSPGMR